MAKNNTHNQATADYNGLTRKEYKRRKGSSTPGTAKGENCHATSLDKAMIKYPRSRRTFPDIYEEVYRKKDKFNKKGNTSVTQKPS